MPNRSDTASEESPCLTAAACSLPNSGLVASILNWRPCGIWKSFGSSILTSSGLVGSASWRDCSAASRVMISLKCLPKSSHFGPLAASKKVSGSQSKRIGGALGAVGVSMVAVTVDAGEAGGVAPGAAADGDGAAGAGEDGGVAGAGASVLI